MNGLCAEQGENAHEDRKGGLHGFQSIAVSAHGNITSQIELCFVSFRKSNPICLQKILSNLEVA